MFWREQEPRHARYGASGDENALPSDVMFERVVAYGHRFGKSAAFDEQMAGCAEEVLSDDGRLCPSVVANGHELSAEQIAILLKLSALPPARHRLRCVYDPHHSFVFYDARGIAVSDIGVCFECGEWSLGGAPPLPVPEGAYRALAALCRDLGMRGCPADKPPAKELTPEEEAEQEVRARLEHEQRRMRRKAWLDSGAPERPSKALGIEPSRKLSEMSIAEQKLLCAWRTFETERPVTLEYERTKTRLRFETYNECLETFPRCDTPLGELENAAFHWTTSFDLAAPEACLHEWLTADTARCLWGIDTNPPAPLPYQE
jgi:hypothetical protein